MTLCLNCLETHAERPTPVGHGQGDQRDTWRPQISLCAPCREALVEGDLATIHDRYRPTRQVTRG
jgi:hypothetical protein